MLPTQLEFIGFESCFLKPLQKYEVERVPNFADHIRFCLIRPLHTEWNYEIPITITSCRNYGWLICDNHNETAAYTTTIPTRLSFKCCHCCHTIHNSNPFSAVFMTLMLHFS